jgi:hypothetical protein
MVLKDNESNPLMQTLPVIKGTLLLIGDIIIDE